MIYFVNEIMFYFTYRVDFTNIKKVINYKNKEKQPTNNNPQQNNMPFDKINKKTSFYAGLSAVLASTDSAKN
ncbi:hypothetical protein CRN15_02335 [Raoultella planticola]|nr:hypothetical protein CRT62_05280 [Raoultella planticola]ATM13768.1 hypothetical protein CRN15_02335 [Raoultella planticola]OAZ79624.1 hypothetical protein AYO04_26740 [Raoultella planticola]OAZ80171.1 hypothetical protein AYO05_23720 [Raoultella planticola]OZP70561.1 hypothetical protein CIG23_28405 [Raoultella planticola]